ncbi:MAG: FtsX-like permease family protein [Pseudomonadota bacterium]
MSEASFSLAFRLARRELRGGLAGFRIFIACLALGVAAIAGVGSVSSALTRGLSERGQDILGGDLDVRLLQREARPAEYAAFGRDKNEISRTIEMRAMARTDATQSLVELKSVDKAYPLYGAMKLAPDMTMNEALAAKDGVYGAIAEPSLVARLGLKIGDTFKVGSEVFQLRAEIVQEPDRIGDGFALGPRVMINDVSLAATQLLLPGSLASFHYRIKRPENLREAAAIKSYTESLQKEFPDAGWRIQDRSDSAPGLRRFVERVALFLSFVGLTALVVGGVGVANAVKSYLDGKRDVIAIFKSLGAPGALIFRVYLVQVMALAIVGIVLGLAIGAAVPFLLETFAGHLIPVPAALGLYWGPLVLAGAYGVLAALAFAIWPLGRARDVPPTALFRDTIAPTRSYPRAIYIAATVLSLAVLGLLAIFTAERPIFALWFVAGAGLVFLILRVAASLIMDGAKRIKMRSASMRLALANLYRPGAATPAVMLSLGLGLTLLTTVSLIDGNLRAEISKDLLGRAPSFFFVDIQPDQMDRFEAQVRAAPDVTKFERVPMLRGRIVALNGVPADQIKPAANAAWSLQGDRGITYAHAMPDSAKLVQGAWWPDDYKGEELVSFDEELAKGLGLKLGDTITVNVLGRDITAKIANTRVIDWQSMGINFIMIFSPGVLEGAPHSALATVTMEARGEANLERGLAAAFPNVTSVRVKLALEQISLVLSQFSLAVRSTGSVTLLSGVLVLAGAMAAGFRARLRDSVVLKVLGATRLTILGIYVREYLVLGLATALIAAAAGSVASYAVVVTMMQMQWHFLPVTLLSTVVLATLATIVMGLAGTYGALSAPAARRLRGG